jgi:hypothetical protein
VSRKLPYFLPIFQTRKLSSKKDKETRGTFASFLDLFTKVCYTGCDNMEEYAYKEKGKGYVWVRKAAPLRPFGQRI